MLKNLFGSKRTNKNHNNSVQTSQFVPFTSGFKGQGTILIYYILNIVGNSEPFTGYINPNGINSSFYNDPENVIHHSSNKKQYFGDKQNCRPKNNFG